MILRPLVQLAPADLKSKLHILLNLFTGSEIIMVSPVRPVAEGDSVTLGCKMKRENVLSSSVDFYKNGKLIQNDTRGELFIPAVSKSDEGLYKCERRDSRRSRRSWTSPESWMSVKCEYD